MTFSMMKPALLAGGMAFALMASGCAPRQQGLPTPVASKGVPITEKLHGPAMWAVSDEDTTIYLFGTVHVLPEGVEWMDEHLSAALASSDELVTEVDMSKTEELQAKITSLAMLPQGQNLREMMPQADRQHYEETLVSLGMPVGSFDPVEPWFAAMTLSVLPLLKAGYNTDRGVEMVLLQAAGPDVNRGALETLDFQLNMFDGMPQDKQLEYLASVVDGTPTITTTVDQMLQEWVEGDSLALAALMNSEMADEEIHDRLLISRNKTWAGWIAERMDQPGTVFIAVGAGHLAGKGSVQDQLAKRGLRARRVH